MTRPHAANLLGGESSPYLLAHAANPVHWQPWGPAALERARTEDRPIFLSVGYSACHWCHVMERESFRDPRIAELLNGSFVNVKVDREERPEVDAIYMKAVMAMTGSGGWPLSVFLTPDLEPFFGGTYFPPYAARGQPGFANLVEGIARGWRDDRPRAVTAGRRQAKELRRQAAVDTRAPLDPSVLDRSLEMLRGVFDPRWGGFGDAPKFPRPTDLRLCLRHHRRTGRAADLELATLSLDRMATGGIFDHLGGGFHRYSTDESWRVPHFEKMLYDNALLVPAYLEGYLVTRDPAYVRVAGACAAWMREEMRTPEGGFASSQDADSEGEEGLFFTWTPDEMTAVLGARASLWAQEWFDVDDDGNFELGRSVLARPDPAGRVAARLRIDPAVLEEAMATATEELRRARARRPRPATDDKVLAGWNGLAVSALAQLHQILGDDGALDAARGAMRFLLGPMRASDGRLHAVGHGDRARLVAGLADYAYVIQGLLDLWESDFDPRWLRAAIELADVVEAEFRDSARGGYFTTAESASAPLARLKSEPDGALPSGDGVHALNLLRLAELTGDGRSARRAEDAIVGLGESVNRYPVGYGAMLMAVDFLQAGPREIVLAGRRGDPRLAELLVEVRRSFVPRVVALADPDADDDASDGDLVPLAEGKVPGPAGARAYVCRGYACREPIDDPAALRTELED